MWSPTAKAPSRPRRFPAYCAVALAGLGWLPDTILSRSVIIRMRRKLPGEQVEPFGTVITPLAATPCGRGWQPGPPGSDLADARPEMPEGVEDRDADIWEPLLAMADSVGGEWPKRARVAAVSLVAASKGAEPSLGIRLLADLRTVFGEAAEMRTTAILNALHNLPESPWNDLKGKPINDHGLAVRLRQYDIRSKQVRIGEVTLKGYTRSDFFDAWRRYAYLPRLPLRAKQAKQAKPSPIYRGQVFRMFRTAPQMFRMAFRRIRRPRASKAAIKPTLFRMFRMFRLRGKAGAMRRCSNERRRNPHRCPGIGSQPAG